MLLFSTILDINKTMTRESFVKLVIEWNQTSTYERNIIPDLKWDGNYNTRWGDAYTWLSVKEYQKKIIAVRYEKKGADGSIWDTDYVMNFEDMKMSVRLDRSYAADALSFNPRFSTPHFITLLEQKGYLKSDGDLPVTREPVFINEENVSLLCDVINGTNNYRIPVVFISRTFDDEEPVDVRKLAARLKGVAHVLVQENTPVGYTIREQCNSSNEYNGAIGIYFPNTAYGHKRFLYHSGSGYDEFLMEKVLRTVIQYCNSQMTEPLFTWLGVNNALLLETLGKQKKGRMEAEAARKKAEEQMNQLLDSLEEEEGRLKQSAADEANKILDGFDNDLQHLQRQIEELTKANEILQYENQGMKAKLDSVNEIPILYMGDEFEFYPGEIKDLLLLVLSESVSGTQERTRRSDIIKDIIRSNDYQQTSVKRAEEVKKQLKSYDGMTGPLRQSLEDMGFVIADDGKHYKLTYYGDARYQVIFSKTPSDHRTGKNTFQKLNKLVF